RAGDQRVDRADVDDAAEAALAHAGQHGAGQAGDADQHHLHQEVPLGDRELFQRGDVLQAGVVDQYVDRARDRGQGGGDAVVGGDVQDQGFGRTAGFADARGDRVGGFAVDVGDDQVVPGCGQLGGDAGADAAAGAGDQDAAGGHGRLAEGGIASLA